MLQRQTQTAAFWRDQLEVTATDLDYLHDLLLDTQVPQSTDQLAISLVTEYIRRENAKIESELAKGETYMPQDSYEVGQTLVFPALEFSTGEISSVRPGQNPEHGDFDVITVQFGDDGGEREFASSLTTPHRLNQTNGGSMLDESTQLSPEEIYSLYRAEIDESLLFALEEGERSEAFVQVDEKWLLSDMLAEVHIGHLNIAEAMIEIQDQPLATEGMLAELDLDENVSAAMQVISLNHALAGDERFDMVDDNGQPVWYLKRMEPEEVINTPPLLRYQPVEYNRSLMSVGLLQLEWELDDEWGESSLSSELPAVVPSTNFTLIYPHRKYGTMPLSGRTKTFFPTKETGKSKVTLVDGRWGTQFTGWVVHEGRYIAGLGKWMEDHGLPVGAQITLERSGTDGEIVVDYRTRRSKREWARIGAADLDAGRITFEMNKIPVACEYDENLIVADTDPEALEELSTLIAQNGTALAELVEQAVSELTKLNPQGTVHAKSVYSAVNMVRRCPPAPIFYALISNRRFRDVGGGLFTLA